MTEFLDVIPQRQTKYLDFAADLMANPLKWAVIDPDQKKPHVFAHQIRNGMLKAFRPKGAFDAKCIDKTVYACYLGGGK